VTPVIEVADVSKSYKGMSVAALDHVSLNVPAGSIFGLLGPNGAGKTTLISILLGLVRRDAGEVTVGGFAIDRDLRAARALCGFAPQDLAFYPMLSVAENLAFFGAAGGLDRAGLRTRTDAVVTATQLQDHLRKRADRLSGGLKRRLNLALALLHVPKILFLDEPTAGVDPQSRAFIVDVVRSLRDGGVTVIYTSHYMDEVQQVCDRIAVLDHGRVIAEGALDELLTEDASLEDLFLRITKRRLRD
jgi:ABC-2 type transport system ATP-binding protein